MTAAFATQSLSLNICRSCARLWASLIHKISNGGGGMRTEWQEWPKMPACLKRMAAMLGGSRWQRGRCAQKPSACLAPGDHLEVDRIGHRGVARAVGMQLVAWAAGRGVGLEQRVHLA